MAFLDHEGSVEYEFQREVVFVAAQRAVRTLPGMRIATVDKTAWRLVIKSGMSLFSWGENMSLALTELAPTRTRVAIRSTPKTGALGGGPEDMGKNRKNIERIIAALSTELSKQPRPRPAPAVEAAPSRSIEERLATLTDLLKKGAITSDDFEKRKAAILDEV